MSKMTEEKKESWVTLESVNNLRAQHGLKPFSQEYFDRADKQRLGYGINLKKVRPPQPTGR